MTSKTPPAMVMDESLPPQFRGVWPVPPEDKYAPVGHCRTSGTAITLCYNVFGDPKDPCVLLIMGLNCPGPYWDTRFCALLAKAGNYVVRYDNRDSGLSTRLDHLPTPFILRLALPRWLSPCECPIPYTIDDMADDAVRLLDHLDVRQAHVVGCSMGGMIAQSIAVRYTDRVRSLTLLSSSSGVPMPKPRILLRMLDSPKDGSEAAIVDYKVRNFRAMAGRLPFPEEEFRIGVVWTVQRSSYEGGSVRHLTAIARSPDRTNALKEKLNVHYQVLAVPQGRGAVSLLREVAGWVWRKASRTNLADEVAERAARLAAQQHQPFIPVLILHGGSDSTIPPANAETLANIIPGARLVMIPAMGHYFPSSLFEPLAQEIQLNVRHGEAIANGPPPSSSGKKGD